MHELSVAQHLIEIACEQAAAAGARAIRTLHLRVGELSGVSRDALQFCFQAAAEGTLCDGASLVVEVMPVRVRCDRCGREASLPGPTCLICPHCQTPAGEVVGGRELDLVTLEIVTDATASA